MLKISTGDLFASQAQTLVNAVNCVGVMGKGIALEFKKPFDANFRDYVARCSEKKLRLGEPYVFHDPAGKWVVNFPTKDHWRNQTSLQSIQDGLDYFVSHREEWGVTSIAFPALGCGEGGLRWTDVEPLMWERLEALPIDIEIYAPLKR